MNKSVIFLILSLFLIGIAGCKEPEVKQISKEGSIESILSVDHLDDSHDIITTTHKIWVKNEMVKTTIHRDTIPTLGVTYQEAENSDGDTKTVPLKRDYEVYITVK